jgi:outer membrane protein assembly factor BamD (BamD/ComL family)
VAVQTPPRASPAPSAPAERPEASDLAEQNRLFAEASSARRRGASSEAIARYDAFLARYPSSQLAESAMVERMRLLGASNPTAGAAAAREYLRRYPAGFARQEALGLAAAQP